MKAVLDIPVPQTWTQPTPPQAVYVIDGVTVTLSVVQGLPEDPAEWIRVEAARRGTGAAQPTLTHVKTETGYPALLGETSGLLIVMYQFLELGAVAVVHGPCATYEQHIAAIREVLMRVRVKWGVPLTLYDLLDGAVR